MLRRLARWLVRTVLKRDLDALEAEIKKLKEGSTEYAQRVRVWQQQHSQHLTAVYNQAYANGEQIGQAQAINAVWAAVHEREGNEITAADIERARKGLVH